MALLKRPEIVCHRGANRVAPENTLAAARQGVAWGADYIEVDVNMSADGVHYVLHGPALDKTTNGRGNIHEMNAHDLDQLDAGSWFSPEFAGERIPRLEEFLAWVKGKAKVFFDIKRANLPELVRQVHAAGLEEECFFWAEDEVLLDLRRLMPHAVIKVNVENAAQVAAAQERFGAQIIEVRLKHMSQAIAAACKARGIRVMIYHPALEPAAYQQILRWGVDLVNLDHADRFLQVFEAADASLLAAPLPRVQRVVLFMLDGCRPDALTAANPPHVERIIEEGAITLTAQTVMPSITLPCHSSIFRSQLPAQHGIVSNEWTPGPELRPSMVDIIRQTGYDTAAFYTWEPLRNLALPGSVDTVFYRALSFEGFQAVCDSAVTWVQQLLPVFSFVYLEATDAYGHLYGWMSPAYLQALGMSDEAVGRVLAGLEEVGALDDTLVVIMADHGGHAHGHGTDAPEDMTVPVIFWGPGVKQGYSIEQPVSTLDVAPTILYALGIPQPDAWQGKPLTEIFA